MAPARWCPAGTGHGGALRHARHFRLIDVSRFGLVESEAIVVVVDETDDSRFGLVESDAIVVVVDETDDSRFGLVESDAIVV
jgi:hypothetical protein